MIDKLTTDSAIVELDKLVNEPDVDITGIQVIVHRGPDSYSVRSYGCSYKTPESQVADAMMKKGYATGHGDSIADLLEELEWQVAEKEREACAKVCEDLIGTRAMARHCADAIRARGETK
jgi:hypothetical protein